MCHQGLLGIEQNQLQQTYKALTHLNDMLQIVQKKVCLGEGFAQLGLVFPRLWTCNGEVSLWAKNNKGSVNQLLRGSEDQLL